MFEFNRIFVTLRLYLEDKQHQFIHLSHDYEYKFISFLFANSKKYTTFAP